MNFIVKLILLWFWSCWTLFTPLSLNKVLCILLNGCYTRFDIYYIISYLIQNINDSITKLSIHIANSITCKNISLCENITLKINVIFSNLLINVIFTQFTNNSNQLFHWLQANFSRIWKFSYVLLNSVLIFFYWTIF